MPSKLGLRDIGRGFTLLLVAGGLGVSVAATKPPKSRELDAADWVSANRITTKFSACIAASGMGVFLSSRGPFMFFVPTDSAFAQLPPEELAALLRPENKDRLQAIVLYHVVNGKKLYAKDLLTSLPLVSCEGSPLKLRATRSGTQFVAKGKIINADVHCRNGIVDEIDTVLFPPDLDKIAPLNSSPVPVASQPAETNWDDPPDEMTGATAGSNSPVPAVSAPRLDPIALDPAVKPPLLSPANQLPPGALPLAPVARPVVTPARTDSAPPASPPVPGK